MRRRSMKAAKNAPSSLYEGDCSGVIVVSSPFLPKDIFFRLY
jgi:hypothetical protein